MLVCDQVVGQRSPAGGGEHGLGSVAGWIEEPPCPDDLACLSQHRSQRSALAQDIRMLADPIPGHASAGRDESARCLLRCLPIAQPNHHGATRTDDGVADRTNPMDQASAQTWNAKVGRRSDLAEVEYGRRVDDEWDGQTSADLRREYGARLVD